MRKLPSRKILATLIAGAFFIPQTSFSLGLGEIEVSSALNQKLKADIELLSATSEDTENIIVKLASRKEFSRAGLDRPYSLNDLRFKSEVIDGVPHIIISSSSPIREPFLSFLVEVEWPNGHLLREYTVLLDPPVFMTKSANAVSSGAANNGSANASNYRPAALPVSARASFTPSSVSDSSATSPRSSLAPAVQQQKANKQRVDNYRIKSGDTAWTLADKMRPNQSVTVPQMMFAMLRSNPAAFIDENINGLKRGYILRVPNASQIAKISKAEAKALTREHWALWRQYQQSQADQPVSAMPAADQAASVDSVNTADGESSGVTGNSHLAIVSAGSGVSTSGSKDLSAMTAQELRAELTLARERVESERVEKEALQSRINTLEQITENREGLLVVENNELSDVQALNTPVDEAAIFSDEVSPQVTEEGLAAEAEAAVPENVASADAAASVSGNNVSKSSDPLTTLLNSPVLLAAAGGGLLLIVAIIALIVKRRKTGSGNDEPDEANGLVGQEDLDEGVKEEAVSADDSAADEHAVADAEEAENSDTGSTKNQGLSDMTDATESDALVADEAGVSSDDVIAEADVYLAYGIYQQAEDILKQALLENPERDDYRLKLAEIHYASKNAIAFVEVAGEIKNRADNENSSEWKKVLVMGQDLCANDPLFNAEAVVSDTDLKLDDELKLPDMDSEVSDSGSATNEMSDEVPEEIEFDLSDAGAIEESEVEEEVFELDISAAELDISTQDDSDGAAGTNETLAEDEIDITFDLDDNSDNKTEVEEEISLDLSDEIQAESETGVESLDDETSKESEIEEEVSLDLSDEAEGSQSDAVDEDTQIADEPVTNKPVVEESVDDTKVMTAAAANDIPEDEGDFDLTNLDGFDEVSTKLDLARAYLDMGDHDGTRGILEEVMVDGTDKQKQEANELMERLAS